MNQNEYAKNVQSSELKQDLWSEYMESLEEEKKDEPISVSERVQKDLASFIAEEKSGSYRKSREKAYSNRRRTAGGAIVIGVAAMTIFAAVTGILITERAVTRDTEPYIYVDPEFGEDFPEYADPYSELGSDLAKPYFMIEGERTYQLPLPVNELLSEGWTVAGNSFAETASEVGADPVTFTLSKYGDTIDVMLVSPTGEKVAVEDALIIGLGTSDSYFLHLPGDVYVGEYEYSVEDALDQSSVEWTKTGKAGNSEYRLSADTENEYGYDAYQLKLKMTDDSLTNITMVVSKTE